MCEDAIRLINHVFRIIAVLLIVFPFISCETKNYKDPLTPEERAWLIQHDGKITIAVEAGYAPFAFIDENGESRGLATEYIELLENKLNFKINKIKFNSLNEILDAAKNKEIDIVNAVTRTQNRTKYLLFTKPFIEIPNVIIVRKDQKKPLSIGQMKTMKISLVKGYAITEHLIDNYNDLEIEQVPDDLTALLNVSFSRTDAAIIDLATASYFMEQKGITNLRIAGNTGHDIKLAIASRNDWPVLNQILAKSLSTITDNERELIKNRWFSFGRINLFESQEFWTIILTAFSVFLVFLGLILVWNRVLKREVAQRTSQLKKELIERTMAENEIKKQKRLFETMFDTIPDGVVITNTQREILLANKGMETTFGYLPGDLVGKSTQMLYADTSRYNEAGASVFNNNAKRSGELYVTRYRNKNGREFTGETFGAKLFDENNNWIGNLGIMRDITEREQSEIRIQQAQKMESVGRLAGGVAHDFNNMLGVILGHTELALLQADEHHELHDDLKEIQKAAKRSADITKQLLTFARKQVISPRQMDLNDTVERMLNMLRRLIGEDIDLVWKPTAYLWPVEMDPSQIDQILANLCVNARDAIGGVGKLTIETGIKTFDEEYCSKHPGFIPGDFVLLAVSDNGCGMGKEVLDNLFEPFFTTKDVGKGTGLGLATIFGIVKQNNGFINVYSEPGQGSTFKIYLPRIFTDEDTDKVVPEKKAAAGGTETILLVEDEPSILRMTRMMLERKGYSVLPAATPGEAIDLAKTHTDKIHLLMTDVVMPEMNGRDLAGQLIPLYPEIKILFMSGYTANVIAHHGVLDDGVAFIQKPFSMADMAEKVRI
jgi:PAS domain S-box-containing protein